MLHEEFGVSPAASLEEVRRAHRAWVRLLHPDQFQDKEMQRLAALHLGRINAIAGALMEGKQPETPNDHGAGQRDSRRSPGDRPAASARRRGRPARPAPQWRIFEPGSLPALGAGVLLGLAIAAGIRWWTAAPGAENFATAQAIPIPGAGKRAAGAAGAAGTSVATGANRTGARASFGREPATGARAAPRKEPEKGAAISGTATVRRGQAPAPRASSQAESTRLAQAGAAVASLAPDTPGSNTPGAPMAAPDPLAGEPAPAGGLPRTATGEVPEPPSVTAAIGKLRGPSVLAGTWLYARPVRESEAAATHPPEFIEVSIREQDGIVSGRYHGRYRVANLPLSPDVRFRFEGRGRRLPWTGADGSRGEIQLEPQGASRLRVHWLTTETGTTPSLMSGSAVLVRQHP